MSASQKAQQIYNNINMKKKVMQILHSQFNHNLLYIIIFLILKIIILK